MRVYRASGLIALLCFVPNSVSASEVKKTRKVELVVMGQPAPAADGTPAMPVAAPDAGIPEAFRVHDLSRRYVEYQMGQEFAASAEGQSEVAASYDVAAAGVAPVSSIAVPGWMKGQYPALAAVPYTPGCASIPYRPAGFLKPDAEARRAAYYGMMSAIACEHGIPTGLFDAMIIQESRYNPAAISKMKAYGLAQLMPGTAAQLGINPYDPVQNLRGGARYLRTQLDTFGQVHLALAAYNAGPGRVKGGAVPRIRETQGYVATILDNWSRLRGYGAVQQRARFVPEPKGRTVAVSSF
ncbi:lytic transglycosylase domain-containing protein [Sphingobium yanoikuyae]|nr:lytic transglycosylase domain-containing protein [Sphingobium yanoikuyae]